ncbi:MAG: CAP domain-containing protein [Leptolyngbyaceae bacterium]|nr:CAP domain-containing protein [Leptolyngbyaceae bacterium]
MKTSMRKSLAYATLTSLLLCLGCSDSVPGESPSSDTTEDTTETPASEDQPPAAGDDTASDIDPSETDSSETEISDADLSEANFPDMVRSIHQQINEFRRSQDLPPLSFNPVLSEQARQHSLTMAENGTLSHDGFDERVSAIQKAISLRSAAENVAANSGFDTPAQQAVEGWLTSEEHRQNILGNFDQTGIGIAENAEGEYYFTQIFIGS